VHVSTDNLESLVSSITLELLLRKEGLERFTLANHDFLQERNVFHSDFYDTKIDEVMKRYYVAMTKLNPSHIFINESYFQEESLKRLVESDKTDIEAFFEVEEMSTELMTLMHRRQEMRLLVRSTEHSGVSVIK
jgi:hypothetical protein